LYREKSCHGQSPLGLSGLVALPKIPDTGRVSVFGTNYWAIYTCIVWYYYQHYTGQFG